MKKLFTSVILLWISSSAIAQNFTLNGDATQLSKNKFQLTPVDTHKVGTIWYENRINLYFDFRIKTRIFFGKNDGGADGIAFVLQDSSNTLIGGKNEGMGYLGIKRSLIVEFDTYHGLEKGDLPDDHLGIMKNGDINHLTENNLKGPFPLLPNIEDEKWHDATFSWNAKTRTLTVSFLSQAFTYVGDIVNIIFYGNHSVFWGFTSTTGGLTNLQQVEIVSFEPLPVSHKDSMIAVPSAFTPNGNNNNDRLKPIPYDIRTLTFFKVFNRWGQLVFETNTLGVGWDGTLKGKPQPTETYMWILEGVSPGGRRIKQSGRSVLIR